tara:strand:- start:149 stop:484 length:336 start_codon:yes stop_codon:yes gene_type:complete
MSKIINIASETTTTLLTSTDYSVYSATNKRGSNNATVSKIIIANASASSATITVQVYETGGDNTTFVLIRNLNIPPKTSFVWDEVFSFNVATHNLRITNSGTDPGLTIITN